MHYFNAKDIPDVRNIGYLLYLPEGYGDSDEPWPVIFFLHGSGEGEGKTSHGRY